MASSFAPCNQFDHCMHIGMSNVVSISGPPLDLQYSTVAVPGQLSEKEKKAVARMDKKISTAEEEPAEPSERQPRDDDDDEGARCWKFQACKVTGKEQSQGKSQGKGQGKSKAGSQGKEGPSNEEACQSVAEETFTEVGKRVLNTPARA